MATGKSPLQKGAGGLQQGLMRAGLGRPSPCQMGSWKILRQGVAEMEVCEGERVRERGT